MLEFNFIGGTRKYIKGKTLKELDQKTSNWGQINFVTNGESYPFGECHGIAFKAAMTDVIEIADDAFQKKVDEGKAEHEKQRAAHKTDAEHASAMREVEAVRHLLKTKDEQIEHLVAAFEYRKATNRLKRLWGIRHVLAWKP